MPWRKTQSDQDQEKVLKCLTLNARSIINKLDDFQALIFDLEPDIVGVTETWANTN